MKLNIIRHTRPLTLHLEPKAALRGPKLIRLTANRSMASDGRWHPDLMAAYLIERRDRWVGYHELAKTAFGSAIPTHTRKVRSRVVRLFRQLVPHNLLLIIWEDDAGGDTFVKIFNPASVDEQERLDTTLKLLQYRKRLRPAEADRARQVMQMLIAEHGKSGAPVQFTVVPPSVMPAPGEPPRTMPEMPMPAPQSREQFTPIEQAVIKALVQIVVRELQEEAAATSEPTPASSAPEPAPVPEPETEAAKVADGDDRRTS